MDGSFTEYRIPDELYHLFCIWGRAKYNGMPRLGYPGQAAACGEYIAPYPTEDDRKEFDQQTYDRLCITIDVYLNEPDTRMLVLRFRERKNLRESKKEFIVNGMEISKTEYKHRFKQVIQRIEEILDNEDLWL